ncbi:actinin alpha 2 [Linnemannia schmuckeri]|uniref:Actinin alpha 2 n=1 Tax=Linnemannia schmuckeri TaxID=64567 RepID=A0A9P5VA52_9FUNG|nr:actinin alpha 2 [Linnemannia schmuckeri]
MSWLLKSKRLQSAGHGANTNGTSNNSTHTNNGNNTGNNVNSIYSLGSSNLSNSSLSGSTTTGLGQQQYGGNSSNINLSTTSLSLPFSQSNINISSSTINLLHTSTTNNHLDAGEDMVRSYTAASSQLETQKTAFMRWVNVQLSANNPSYMPMTSIERDLRDGKRLIALLEAVSQEPLKPERGNMRIHQMANVSKALAFLEKRTDEGLGTVGNEDIVDGNVKLTLGLVWIIIYRFQIQQMANTVAELYPFLAAGDDLDTEEAPTPKGKKKGSSHQVDAKQALLRWVRYQLEDYSDVIPPIQDFHRSWRTGLVFAALIHRHDPEFLPEFYSAILPLTFEIADEWRRTLTRAFEVAYECMKLPRLLDPEDLVEIETPDERSIMTYVSEYYNVMSKAQSEQDPALAEELRLRRRQAKDERLALAGEDQQARRRRLQEEQERKRREEEEELERIRLKRMEIEGWSIRAAERAKEEEEALRKRREEEEERRLQRQLRREQREREKDILRRQSLSISTGADGPQSAGIRNEDGFYSYPSHLSNDDDDDDDDNDEFEKDLGGNVGVNIEGELRVDYVFSNSNHDDPDLEPDVEPSPSKELKDPEAALEPMDLERRQQELDEKLAEYHMGILELSEWIKQQDKDFPHAPDTTSLLDRSKDLEPLTDAIKAIEEEQAVKEHVMSHLHDVREELLEYENPDLPPEQISEMDRKWWELETIWTALTNKVVETKDTAEEVKWIIDCTQEIDRVNGEILKFESQLEAFAEKRSQETPQNRSQKSILEQQDVNLSSISFLLKTYVDFLTALMDPKVHHYDAPEHLTTRNNELTTVRLPHLAVIIEKAQQNLSNDRLLRSFLDAFVLSEAWIGESVVWLANIEVPSFVSKDEWKGWKTVKEYMARDLTQDADLDFFMTELQELKGELEEEQGEVTTFRLSGFAKLDEQAEAVKKAVVDTQDITAAGTTKTVQDLMRGVMNNLEKVEDLLPKEATHCAYATRVLEYLLTARSILNGVEDTMDAINAWEMRQPDAEVEALVLGIEDELVQLEATFQQPPLEGRRPNEPTVQEAVQKRHSGLVCLVKDLRVCFHEKQEAIKGDRQMKEFLEVTLSCQAVLQDIKSKFSKKPTWIGFGLDDKTPLDIFAAHVQTIGQSFDKFESVDYLAYEAMGARVTAMAATSGARQDPAIVQSKLHAVKALLDEVKILKSDREHDSETMAECRRLTESLSTLRADLAALETEYSALEHLEPSQHGDLMELGHRSSALNNQLVALEQESVFQILEKDKTCTGLFEDIRRSQVSIQQTQDRLQTRLGLKQQWDTAWSAFTDRAVFLQQYLEMSEKDMVERGYIDMDSLAADEQVWKKTADSVRETAVANTEHFTSLEEFKAGRLPELAAIAKTLQRVVNKAGDLHKFDEARAEQHRESEQLQQNLQKHLDRLFALNSKEKHHLDTVRQRLLWVDQLGESQSEINVLSTTCKDAVNEYTAILEASKQDLDTSGLNHKAAVHLKEQIQHLVSIAGIQKHPRINATLRTYADLKELAPSYSEASTTSTSTPQDGVRRLQPEEKQMPAHLENELVAFHQQYTRLDLQLNYAGQLADHAAEVAHYLEKADGLDGELLAMASDLKEDIEASHDIVEKLEAIRGLLSSLPKELELIVSNGPKPTKPAAADEQHEGSSDQSSLQDYLADLESILKRRLDHTSDLDRALGPLLAEYQELLRYQDGLRNFATELEDQRLWVDESNDKVQSIRDQVEDLSSSWPGESGSRSGGVVNNFSTPEAQLPELDRLKAELTGEAAHVENKKKEYKAIQHRIQEALESATIHSKVLQVELEDSLDTIENAIEELETDIRHRSYQVDCLEKRALWEQKLMHANSWCHDIDQAISQFAIDQAQWTEDANDSSVDEELQLQKRLDTRVSEFETQLKAYDVETKPKVDQTWTTLGAALVFVGQAIPSDFENRQSALGTKRQVLQDKVTYVADVVKQRKALQEIASRLQELGQHRSALASGTPVAIDSELKSSMSVDQHESRINELAQELESCFEALEYPVDRSTEESKSRSDAANAIIRQHIDFCRAQVDAAQKALDQLLYDREFSKRLQKLTATEKKQNKEILDKTDKLERINNLLNWAHETTDVVASLYSSADSDSANATTKEDEDDQSLSPSPSTAADLSESTPTLAALSVSASTTSVATLTPSSPTAGSLTPISKAEHSLSVQELSRLPKATLEAISVRAESLLQEIEEMVEYKREVKDEVLAVDPEYATTTDNDAEAGPEALAKQASILNANLAHLDTVESAAQLREMETKLDQNNDRISELNHGIETKLTEFDTATEAMLFSLTKKTETVALALKERQRMDDELARQQEAERLRVEAELLRAQRALEMQQLEQSTEKFMAWSETQRRELHSLWENNGYFAKNTESATVLESETIEGTVAFLETDTIRLREQLSFRKNAYLELKERLDAPQNHSVNGAGNNNDDEHASERRRHSERITSAWSSLEKEVGGYNSILKPMKEWSSLRIALAQFEKEGLAALEKRVEALRWVHWEAFQLEENSLLELMAAVEDQARELSTRAETISATATAEFAGRPDAGADQKAILEANKAYFEKRMESIPARLEAAKAQMEMIHETSKEIALHGKFHADLVRIETAIAQQIDAVKVRLGSLERSSCFALNSQALEAMVMAANEVSVDGQYQFSVLQEVEYPALQQTAFDLDMLATAEDADIESRDLEGDSSAAASKSGVEESMERIRQALKQLESYIEEDCFETLMAAKFYTHSKATEDIRQWITACRDSMAQTNSPKNREPSEQEKRQQTKEWKTKHLETLERKLDSFGATIQHYDELSGDFMLLHHPQSSTLDLNDPTEGDNNHNNANSNNPASMRVILRQTVQERTKRTREDWELLKQEFLAKTAALEEQSSGEEDGGVNGSENVRQGSVNATGAPVVKAKALGRFGAEILDDISRVSREIQELFDHGTSSNHATLSLAVESDGALVKSKQGEQRLEMVEAYIREVLQGKVQRFDAMLAAVNAQNEQGPSSPSSPLTPQDPSSPSATTPTTPRQARHQERMVGVAMQRGLIAESMSRLVDSCHRQRKEVEEHVRVQNAMDLIHEASLLCDSMMKTVLSADSLLQPTSSTGPSPSVSLYNLSSASASSTTSLTSIQAAQPKSPTASSRGSVSTSGGAATLPRSTATRQRGASRANVRRSFSLSALSEEEVQQWEADYRNLMDKFDGYTHDIDQRLDSVSTMADRLNDWRLDENYGIATEHWQRVKKAALAKKQELDRIWALRSGQPVSGDSGTGGVHPLRGSPSSTSRPSLTLTTASNNRVKAILGSPVDSSIMSMPRKKRFSTGNIMSRSTFVPPSPTPSMTTTPTFSGPSHAAGRSNRTAGRVRSGTAPGITISGYNSSNSQLDVTTATNKKFANVTAPNLHAMSPTYSQETKRRTPMIRKDDATSSVSSFLHAQGGSTTSAASPGATTSPKQRTVYKPDMSNALDVEVARVVNASGFTMKVQKLKDGHSPNLSAVGASGNNGTTGSLSRHRSDSTSSLVLSSLSDNGGPDGTSGKDSSTNSSPRVVKTIRGQGGRLSVSTGGSSSDASKNGEVGRYVFGDIEPKVCYCRILRSRKVMVRVGGGWSELSKFMEDHASLEQRKSKARLLSASNSSVSVASHFGGSLTVLSGSEASSRRPIHGLPDAGGSSDSLSDMSGGSGDVDGERLSVSGGGGRGFARSTASSRQSDRSRSASRSRGVEDGTPRIQKKKELVYHVRPSDDLSLKAIKFVKNGAGEGLVAI